MEEKKDINVIDLRQIASHLWKSRKLYYKTLPIVFVLSCIYILGVPRTYNTETKLAPEMDNSLPNGALGSIAASFGFDLSDMQTTDAITPLLYPDLMEDNGFVSNLFHVIVETQDKKIKCSYYDYLKKHQKPILWATPYLYIKNLLKKKPANNGQKQFDPYCMTKDEDEVAKGIRGNVKFSVDKKTGVITINTKAQDALVCKTLADSVRKHLQLFITNYRTNKARTDYDYYKKLTLDAKQEYEKARQRYASFSDASTNATLKSVQLKMEDLENDMQLKFNTYSTLNTQLQAANAKVQERTPAFTIIQGASVPVKPTSPKRMIFVLGMLILTFICTSIYLSRKHLHFNF